MIERVECKTFLTLLSILSLLSLASIITAVVLSIIWKYIGFMMVSALSSFICSNYLTLKLHYNMTYNYNAIFIGSLVSIVFQIFLIAHLAYLLLKYFNSDQRYFQELTESVFARLYIGYSMSLLGACVGMGYYGCYIIEQGWQCLNYIDRNWLILGAIFTGVVIFLLIGWIYLLSFWANNKSKFDDPIEQKVTLSSQGVQQPVNMIDYFETIKQILKKETKKQINPIKEQLLQDSVSFEEQNIEQDKGKQRIAFITFDQYLKKERQKQQNEKNQQQLIKRLLQEQQQFFFRQEHKKMERDSFKRQTYQQAKKKENITSIALSPDDPNINQIFLESEQEVQDVAPTHTLGPIKQQVQKLEYYPANFTPTTKKQKDLFQQYKKKLLDKYKRRKNYIDNPNTSLPAHSNYGAPVHFSKHPQNIENGRSKKILQRYIKKNKKPCRDQSLYLRTNFQKSRDEPVARHIYQTDQQNELSGQFNQKMPDIPQQTSKQQNVVKETSHLLPIDTPIKTQPQQILVFHKSKTKSQARKKLFEQQKKFLNNQAFSSILSSLVKGVQQASLQSKLKDLKKKRNQNVPKSKRTDKLVDSIRSKFY